jgi:c-di-GMP-related signal transduction protein
LRTVLDIAVAYEMGDWNRVTQLSNVLNLDERFVAECYYEAVQWANESFGQMLES